jgi:hypothetical protein
MVKKPSHATVPLKGLGHEQTWASLLLSSNNYFIIVTEWQNKLYCCKYDLYMLELSLFHAYFACFRAYLRISDYLNLFVLPWESFAYR